MITKNVMKTHEFDDSIFYRVSCDCGSPECDLTLELEYEKELNRVYLNMYKDLHWSTYWDGNPFKTFWRKIKACMRLLFIGHIKVEETLIIKDEEHLQNFIGALDEGVAKLSKE